MDRAIADFEQQGYRLIGGRADYFDHQRAAVVVYQRGSHIINVFSWAAEHGCLPKDTTRNGYHLAEDGRSSVLRRFGYGLGELQGLLRLLRDLGAHDIRH